MSYRIYMDVCCLNRPFDDQTQSRIRLETAAILMIFSQCQAGIWQLVTSNALDVEINQTPNLERRQRVQELLAIATIKVNTSDSLERRTTQLAKLGFAFYDAAHLASAEKGQSDILVTTDDRLIKKSTTFANELSIPVENPVLWLAKNT